MLGGVVNYPNSKIYSDGSHYIAIPYTEMIKKPPRFYPEKYYLVSDEDAEYFPLGELEFNEKDLFNSFFRASFSCKSKERRNYIIKKIKPAINIMSKIVGIKYSLNAEQ